MVKISSARTECKYEFKYECKYEYRCERSYMFLDPSIVALYLVYFLRRRYTDTYSVGFKSTLSTIVTGTTTVDLYALELSKMFILESWRGQLRTRAFRYMRLAKSKDMPRVKSGYTENLV